jgi:ribosome-associated translation inhibitor RaiA
MREPQITYRGLSHSPVMDARIRELTSKLEDFHHNITSVHVVVDELDRHKHKGNLFGIRVDVHIPGAEIVATHQQDVDPYAAITSAFEVVVRQLEDSVRKKRADFKRHRDEPSTPPS